MLNIPKQSNMVEHPQPYFLRLSALWDPATELKLEGEYDAFGFVYCLDAATGLCLWSTTGLVAGYPMGPAIYGNYVVVGSGNTLNIYSL